MMSNKYIQRDDDLRRLLSENKPVPNQEFCFAVKTTVSRLSEKKGIGIQTLRVRRPVIYAVLLGLVCLLLTACTAYAAISLYRRVFQEGIRGTEEQINTHHSSYSEQREQMEGLSPEAAAHMDTWLDFQATEDAGMLAILRGVAESAIPIEQIAKDAILSEFSVYTSPGMEENGGADLYFGVVAPANQLLPEEISVKVNGRKKMGIQWNVPMQSTNNEQYRIYTIPFSQIGWLPDQALISVFIADESFVFQYDFTNGSRHLPKDNTEREQWLEENERMQSKLEEFRSGLTITNVNDARTVHDIEVSVSSVELIGDSLCITVSLHSVASEKLHFDMRRIALSVQGVDYERGHNLFVFSETMDSGDLSPLQTQDVIWHILMPCAIEELNAASNLTLSFVMSIQKNVGEEMNETESENFVLSFEVQE